MNCEYCTAELNPSDKETSFDSFTFCSRRCATLDWSDVSRVPRIFFETDLSRLECPEQVNQVKGWIRERSRCIGQPGLLLHGEISGRGKTRLGTYAFNELIIEGWDGREQEQKEVEKGSEKTGVWLNTNNLVCTYRRLIREHEAKGEWQEELSNASNLFIDDLDKAKPTDGLMELVFSVLDDRFTNRRTTIITTNLNGDGLANRWGDDVGPYLVRRLRDFCMCVDCDVAARIQQPSNVLPISKAS